MSVRLHTEPLMRLESRAQPRSLAWSNPVSWWWAMLTLVSGVNIAAWILMYRELHDAGGSGRIPGMQIMLLLSAAYVFGCAFRSLLPRADVQRICLFDTWLSSVAVGRSVATVAGICRLIPEFDGALRIILVGAVVGIVVYLAFLMTVDVPMYLKRWRADVARGNRGLRPLEGFRDVSTRWVVTYDLSEWREEIAWMSLYFSAAVWASLGLCVFYAVEGHIAG